MMSISVYFNVTRPLQVYLAEVAFEFLRIESEKNYLSKIQILQIIVLSKHKLGGDIFRSLQNRFCTIILHSVKNIRKPQSFIKKKKNEWKVIAAKSTSVFGPKFAHSAK